MDAEDIPSENVAQEPDDGDLEEEKDSEYILDPAV